MKEARERWEKKRLKELEAMSGNTREAFKKYWQKYLRDLPWDFYGRADQSLLGNASSDIDFFFFFLMQTDDIKAPVDAKGRSLLDFIPTMDYDYGVPNRWLLYENNPFWTEHWVYERPMYYEPQEIEVPGFRPGFRGQHLEFWLPVTMIFIFSLLMFMVVLLLCNVCRWWRFFPRQKIKLDKFMNVLSWLDRQGEFWDPYKSDAIKV